MARFQQVLVYGKNFKTVAADGNTMRRISGMFINLPVLLYSKFTWMPSSGDTGVFLDFEDASPLHSFTKWVHVTNLVPQGHYLTRLMTVFQPYKSLKNIYQTVVKFGWWSSSFDNFILFCQNFISLHLMMRTFMAMFWRMFWRPVSFVNLKLNNIMLYVKRLKTIDSKKR